LLYNFSNNGCYEYKIYNNEFKSFIDNISDNSSNLCVGIYMRTYNNIIIGKNHSKNIFFFIKIKISKTLIYIFLLIKIFIFIYITFRKLYSK